MTDCKNCQKHLPDLLLDPDAAQAQPGLYVHLAECEECRTELAELRATLDAMDSWTVPEPSPYFDSRLHARLREAEAAPPESVWERLRAFFLFSTGLQVRPALAAALVFALLLGGGTVAGLHEYHTSATAQVSPAVNDLKILDNNAQALQQMDQLLDDSGSDDSGGSPTT